MSEEALVAPTWPAAGRPGERPMPGPWRPTWHGVRTVAVLELRQRVRSTRWRVALVVWFVLVGAVTALTSGALNTVLGVAGSQEEDVMIGQTMFGIVVFFVLFMGLLVAPTLSATAINGDRAAGTLATLQATLLTAADIAVGKLLAAWSAALAFLAASVPFIVWAVAVGGVGPGTLLGTVALLAAILAVVCAVGLGASALTARPAGSAVLSYLAVAALSVLTLVFFGLSLTLVQTQEDVRVWSTPADWEGYTEAGTAAPPCVWTTEERDILHTERTWWLLAANPFVIVADATPAGTEEEVNGPLSAIRWGVRYARHGQAAEADECWTAAVGSTSPVAPVEVSTEPVWPWGLGFSCLLGAGSLAFTVHRLRIPQSRLPRGTRVA